MLQTNEQYKEEGGEIMGKPKRNDRESYTYNESGNLEVTQQIMDSYNSGVIDPTSGEVEVSLTSEE
jgi:hypothetical protein